MPIPFDTSRRSPDIYVGELDYASIGTPVVSLLQPFPHWEKYLKMAVAVASRAAHPIATQRYAVALPTSSMTTATSPTDVLRAVPILLCKVMH